MNYYKLQYTDSMPAAFGGQTRGPVIKIRPKYKGDAGLLEHEKFHVREWWAWSCAVALAAIAVALALGPMIGLPFLLWAPLAHQAVYRWSRRYRLWSEVRAYRIQLRQYGPSTSAEFAVRALADKYDLGISREEARRLLGR